MTYMQPAGYVNETPTNFQNCEHSVDNGLIHINRSGLIHAVYIFVIFCFTFELLIIINGFRKVRVVNYNQIGSHPCAIIIKVNLLCDKFLLTFHTLCITWDLTMLNVLSSYVELMSAEMCEHIQASNDARKFGEQPDETTIYLSIKPTHTDTQT